VIKRPGHGSDGAAKHLATVTFLCGLLVALAGVLAPPASATPLVHPQTRVAAIAEPGTAFVAPHTSLLAVQGRERAPSYDQDATGSSVAAEGGVASLSASDLSGDVLSNYNRFLKSLPSGAGDTTITQLPDGSYQFSSDVPATNIPGSYATYTKVVGPDGVTTTFYKTTIAPDGSVVSVKVKYP
jgi:hypothetical protein